MRLVRTPHYAPTNGFFEDELFNNFFGKRSESFPAVNIRETDEGYKLDFAAPGFKKEDFLVDVHDHVLTVSAEYKEESKENHAAFTKQEFSKTSFTRSFQLPQNAVNVDHVSGKYENGILHLELPKVEEKKPIKRSIAIH